MRSVHTQWYMSGVNRLQYTWYTVVLTTCGHEVSFTRTLYNQDIDSCACIYCIIILTLYYVFYLD